VQNSEDPQYSGSPLLIEIDSRLVNYTKQIVKNFYRDSGISKIENPRVLDFGAGLGSLATIWRDEIKIQPECAELDPNLVEQLAQQGFKVHQSIDKISERFDFIYTSNVLEHIEDDFQTLVKLKRLLLPGGSLGIYVPAFPILFSELDKSVGHFRRYTKQSLETLLREAEFTVVKSEYIDSLGFVATLLLKFMGFSFKATPNSGRLMYVYDKVLFPISRIVDKLGISKFVGKNLCVTAKEIAVLTK
jgi:SAM-dependent methyltransferase